MLCPHCGGETPAGRGVCTSCHKPLSATPTVAAGVLTPLPEHPAEDSPTILPPPPSSPADPEDEVTRFGSPTPSGGAPTPPPTPSEDEDPDATRVASGPPSTGTPRPRTGPSSGAGGTTGSRPAATGPLSPGQDFGNRYHIIRVLGVGGMGAVYQAWDQALEVAVAVKVVRTETTDDPIVARDLERRFKRELLLARQVTHRNVVRIHDLGEIDGIKYITMPYIQGVDLATLLKRDGKLPVNRALRIARQVASGLAAAHQAGVIHRDLKPANIMIDGEDNAVIMDFGIARSAAGTGPGLTVAGAVVGTVEYMAPEQAKGEEVDQRADIYAFGLIFYDMLVRRRQATGGESAVAELMSRMQQAPPAPRSLDPNVPEAVDQIISMCMQPNAAVRFQKSTDLAAALDSLDAEGHPGGTGVRTQTAFTIGIPAPTTTTAPTVAMPAPVARKNRLPWMAALAAGVLLLAAGGYVFRGSLPFGSSKKVAVAGQAVSLAILPFRNASGDPSLDYLGPSLGEMLRSEVGQSQYLRAVSSDRLNQVMQDLQISQNTIFDPATLRKLAEFTSAQSIMWGQFVRFGSEIRIDATLEDLKGQRAVPLKAQAANQGALLGAVGQLARSVRETLASSPDVLKELEGKSLKPSTQSFDALRFYNEGLQLVRLGQQTEALARFTAAIKADDNFALAHSRLAQTYATLGYDSDAQRSSRRAVELAEALPAHEKYLIQANHAMIQKDQKKAVESYLNLVKASPDDADVRFSLAKLYEDTGSFDAAREHYAEVLKRDPSSFSALFALGRVEIQRDNAQGSLEYLNRALSLSIQLGNDEGKGNILGTIGLAYRMLNKPDDALRYYRESLDIKRKRGEKLGIAETLGEIALMQDRLGKADEALRNHQEALQILRDIGNRQGLANGLIDLGAFYAGRAKLDEALQLFKEALQIQREVGNQNYEALSLNNIGGIYLMKGQYQDALTYFDRALPLREKLNVPTDTALTVHNLADASAKLGQYDQALSYYLRALELWRSAGEKRQAAVESNRIGSIFIDQGRFGAALKSEEEAVKALRDLKDRSAVLAEVLIGYGEGLASIGRFKDARQAADEGLALAREFGDQVLIAQGMNALADVAFLENDLKSARSQFEQVVPVANRSNDRYFVLLARANVAKIDAREPRPQRAAATLRSLIQDADQAGLRYLSLECSIDLAEAMMGSGDAAAARRELERVLGRAESLGAQMLTARIHHLLSRALTSGGQKDEASRHAAQARRIIDDIHREAGTDDVLKRADLAAIRAGTD